MSWTFQDIPRLHILENRLAAPRPTPLSTPFTGDGPDTFTGIRAGTNPGTHPFPWGAATLEPADLVPQSSPQEARPQNHPEQNGFP